MVSGGHDGRVRIWDPARPGIASELGTHDGRVMAVAVLAGGRVVSGSQDGRVRIWDPDRPGTPYETRLSPGLKSIASGLPNDSFVVAGERYGAVAFSWMRHEHH